MNTLLTLTTDGASGTLWLPTPDAPSWRWPTLEANRPCATIGALRCDDEAAARRLLAQAVIQARTRGATGLIGPMDGSTWKTYRAVVASDGSPPFFLEPATPTFLPEAFRAQGFDELAHYTSARVPPGGRRPTAAIARRLQRSGIRMRPFDQERAEGELRALHALSLTAFAANPFYTPIALEEFWAQYRPLLPHLRAELIWMAEGEDGGLRGFLFALPDLAAGPSSRQLIVKTYASLVPGLGGYLLDRLHDQAAALGFTAVIHALMHDDNVSRHNSDRYGPPFRRYALFGRALEGE